MKKPLKILLLSHSFFPDVGGIETISELLADAFSDAGHEVRVLTWSSDNSKKLFRFSVVRDPGFRKLLRQHAWADVIFENNPSLRLSWPSFFFNRPSIVVLQTWIIEAGKKLTLYNKIKFWRLKRATQIVAISNAVRIKCWSAATIIGNSYDAKAFKVIPGITKVYDFVFVGRLVSDKGADVAINALYQLQNKSYYNQPSKKYHLTIIGDGPERIALESLVRKLHLKESVVFKGQLRGKELADCLNQHRFLLVPSLWDEPFGIVALEGMACGCVPVVSDGGGLPDAIGKAGLTFCKGDVDSLTECIKKVLSNTELENYLKDTAKNHLIDYHPDIISKRYLDIIETVA